jgi:hypothetical protein
MARRRGSWWTGTAVGVAVAAHVVSAAATTSEWLVWDAPPACPGREAALDRVRATTREAAGDDVHAEVRIRAESDGRWSATVSVTAGESRSERLLDGASCGAVADAAALIVGLSLAPAPAVSGGAAPTASVASDRNDSPAPSESPASPVPSGPASGPSVEAPPTVVRPRAVTLAPSAPKESTPSLLSRTPGGLTLHAASVVDLGTLPSAGPGIAMGASWRAAPLEIGLDAAVFAAERGTVAETTSGASVGLASASIDACLLVPLGDRVVVAPCAGFALELLTANGFGPPGAFTAEQRVVPLPAAFGDLGLEWWPSRHVGLRAGIRGVVPFERPTFVVLGPGHGPAHRPSAAAAEPSLGLVVRLGK